MKSIRNILFIILMIFTSSCNSEFSNYTKYEKTDWEKNHLKGKVMEVKRFHNGIISDISRYNKYGFEIEYEDYEDGVLKAYKKIKYNEFGKIKTIEDRNQDRLQIVSYEYDDNNNVKEIIKDTKEVYNEKKNISVGKKLLSTYEYIYDKFGGIINEKEYNRIGTCVSETIYNAAGKAKRINNFDENGNLTEYTDYSYRGNTYEEKQTLIGKSGYLDMYVTMIYDHHDLLIRKVISYEDGSWRQISEYGYLNGELNTKTTKWVADTDESPLCSLTPRYKKGDICTTVETYTITGNEYIYESTTYYPLEDIKAHKEIDYRSVNTFKYDKIGNIIYNKDENEENQEYVYEYTYY